MIKNKKQMILVIISFILVLVLGTVSYAFYNYTRTGSTNTVSVGRLNFTSTENNTINLSNVFPTDSTHLDNSNSSTVTINITGDTNYDKGIEYKVSLVDVNNVVNNKEVAMGFTTTATNLGTKSNDYYNDRGSTTNVYNLRESGIVEEGQDILIGYIKPDENGVNGSINITAFIDKNEVGISDTVSRIVNDNLVYGETDAEWIAGRTILTTEEWNSLATDGISFKVKVEANEGIWVQEEKYLVLTNLDQLTDWADIRSSISSIEFSTTLEIPVNAVTSFDATDLSSAGPVKIYTLDDGLGNNTYKAVICADGVIYGPENSRRLFAQMENLVSFNSENFKVDNVASMMQLFYNDVKLKNLDSLISWNTQNLNEMRGLLMNCNSIENIDGLANFDTSGVTQMDYLFSYNSKLTNVDALFNWDVSNVNNMPFIFNQCTNLTNINGIVNWNMSNVSNMNGMFNECVNLIDITGLDNWDTSSITNTRAMFAGCDSLKTIDISHFDMSHVTNDGAMFQETGFETLKMPNNYTRIDNYMFNHNSSYNGSSFTILSIITSIGYSHVFYNFGIDNVFNKFIVESGNTSFKTIDDILYTYDGTRLISVPRGKTFTNNTFEIPEGVTFLNELSFSRNKNIDKLILPNSYVIERYIDENNNNYGFINSGSSINVAIYLYTSIKEYEVKSDNTRYMSYEGCIYSKDGTELIAVPLHYNGVLNIKSGTTTIGQEAFKTIGDLSNIDGITQINIPASVTTIEANQLTRLNDLGRRSTKRVTITIDSGNTAYQIVNNQIVAR